MRQAALGDLVMSVATWNPRQAPDKSFQYIDIAAVDQVHKAIITPTVMAGRDAPSRARQLVLAGDVLVSTVRPNLNAVAAVSPALHGATASTGFCVLRPQSRALDSRYLFHWVKTDTFIADMVRKATGASYPAVSDRIIKNSRIPLPPLDEQRRIAAILDHAALLRARRLRAVELIKSLPRARFREAASALGAERVLLSEVADVSSGITKGRRLPSGALRSVPYLAVSNVQAGHLDLSAVKVIDVSASELERFRLMKNDLLLTEGGDPDKLGRGALWNDELPLALHQNHVFKVRLHPDAPVTPLVLSAWVASAEARAYFLRAPKHTTGIASINKTQLSRLPIPIIPAAVQRRLEVESRVIGEQLSRVQHSLDAVHRVAASLQTRAFAGQL